MPTDEGITVIKQDSGYWKRHDAEYSNSSFSITKRNSCLIIRSLRKEKIIRTYLYRNCAMPSDLFQIGDVIPVAHSRPVIYRICEYYWYSRQKIITKKIFQWRAAFFIYQRAPQRACRKSIQFLTLPKRFVSVLQQSLWQMRNDMCKFTNNVGAKRSYYSRQMMDRDIMMW